jgi:hypothetical protein
MNRTILISIVGLGVLSAAGFARSRAQSSSIATCSSTTPCTPVAVVTQPDGNKVVATCVSVSACDPVAKSRGSSTVYKFTLGDGASVLASGTGTACGSGQSLSGSCSSTGSGTAACATGSTLNTVNTVTGDTNQIGHLFALRAQEPNENAALPALPQTPPEIAEPGDEAHWLVARRPHVFTLSSPALAGPLVAGEEDGAGEWRVDVERALEEARDSLSDNQDEMREALQRAADEARVAQERAREAYNQAMETYRDALRTAQERSRESMERASVERRAQSERGARWSTRAGARGEADARQDRQSTLESRVAALEKAARGRGVEIDSTRSIEERVAELEKHMMKGSLPQMSELFRRVPGDQPATAPRALRLKRAAPAAPAAPVPPLPPIAGVPAQPSEPVPFSLWSAPSRNGTPPAELPRKSMSDADREQMSRAMEELKREAARLREELARMRAEVDRLPRTDGTR